MKKDLPLPIPDQSDAKPLDASATPPSELSQDTTGSTPRLIPCGPSKRSIFEKSKKAEDGYRDFKFPNSDLIQGRSSTIAKSFARSLTPRINPSVAELDKFSEILNLDTVVCVYCGDPHHTWDHFRPLVVGSAPTGYIDELDNLVPACSNCNSSKGNADWQAFMNDEKISPLVKAEAKVREIHSKDGLNEYELDSELKKARALHAQRYEALKRFDEATDPICINIEALFIEKEKVSEYKQWLKLEQEILEALKKAVPLLNELRPHVWERTKELEEKRDNRADDQNGYMKKERPAKTLREG
jgi:hypothetical protein